MSDSKIIANALLDSGAVRVSLDPLFTWSSGLKSPVYCDLRSLNSNVDVRRQITAAFAELVDPNTFDVIAGTATAGIAWAAWLAEALDKPMVYVRGTSKGHGTKQRVEGKIEKGLRVLVLEDLVSTGGSSADTVTALREDSDARVTEVVAINSYKMAKADLLFEELGVQLRTLTDFEVILAALMERGDFSSDEVAVLKDFAVDPAGWAGRHGLS